MPGTFGTPPGFFFPRLTWLLGSIDFQNPLTAILPGHKPVRGQNTSLAGLSETLHIRNDNAIGLVFNALHRDDLNLLLNWYDSWGALGEQSAVTLDRFGTCAGQLEYDRYNALFTKAICTNEVMEPKRLTSARGLLWVYTVTFWQEH